MIKSSRPDSRGGFTLVELLVVITIVAIFATLAVRNLRGPILYHKQIQAASLIGTLIQNARSFAMASEINTGNSNYWHDGRPTRLACGIYFFKGWVNPSSVHDATPVADGTDSEYDVSYSVLRVTDLGYDSNNRHKAPDSTITGTSVADLQSIADVDTRQRVVNLPEGVVLRLAGPSDTDTAATGTALPFASYISYDQYGRLNTKRGQSGSEAAFYSADFNGKDCYLAITYEQDGVMHSNTEPIYVDLRTGERVANIENIGTLNFGTFQ